RCVRRGEESAEPLVRSSGLLPELLLQRGVYAVGPALLLPALELLLGLGRVDATDLDRARKPQAPSDQRLPPELLHHSDARVAPDAEVDAVIVIRAEAGESVVDAGHRVHVVRERPADPQTPCGVRVARDRCIHRDAERVPAEAEVLRIAVPGR